MKIAVGSKNPVKYNAVKEAFSQYFDKLDIISMKTESGVSEMPTTEQEILKGAINRASNCLDDGFDYAVGIEGGTKDTEHGMFVMGYVVIIDKEGRKGIGQSEGFLIPEHLAERIRRGEELGPLMDELTNRKDVKKKGGAIGHFSKGRITRKEAFIDATTLALVRFVNEDFE